ncbi:MAG: hypothetical protein ACJATT_002221 [Myxococcota bacterium]
MTLKGMTETGRRQPAPAGDWVQLESVKGLKHTALVYKAPFNTAPCLTTELQGSLPFMESPGVSGIAPLADYDRESGTFVYKSGTVWSIAEVVRAFADLDENCGHRAGLELAYVTSQILIEASEKGSPHGVWSHRSLSPWRLALRGDGQVRVLGYGLPQVELLEHLAHEASPIKEDSFRYAPPERIEGREEDITSDLFALTLICVELMVGKPVYDGLLADVRQQAARAEGTYRLYRWRELLPATIRDALAPALKYDDDARYRDPAEYVYAMHDLLGSPDIEGPSLMEIVQRVKMAERKGKPIISGRTAALTREELAAMAAELDEPEDAELPPPSMPRPNGPAAEVDPDAEQARWGSVARSGRRSRSKPVETPAPTPVKSVDKEEDARVDSLRQRLRRSRSEGPPSRRTPSAEEEDPRAALRRRLRERPGAASESISPARTPEPPPVVKAPEQDPAPSVAQALSTSSGGAEALLARLRSSSGRRRGGALRPSTPDLPQSIDTRSSAGKPTRGEMAVDIRDGDVTRPETLGNDEPLCAAAVRLGRPVVDLEGRILSAPRLSQEGRWWRGNEPAKNLDPSKPVDVVQVANQRVHLEVRTDGSPGHRFMAPVSTAVPAAQLVAHLVSWLGLPSGEWQLRLGDDTLLPNQLLADLEPTDGQILLLRR